MDYRYEDARECVQFLEALPIAQEDRDKICFLNAAQQGFAGERR